ncbi:MAG: MarR family transcriptional regulator [Hamadaea sp.]|nr:MarR family transcriptional regulator [Hamadaea sp.]NUR48055.1 MarR family transcriptional regulator [Hamadaea sp.]NUT06078.1 MarR family transcriptional regulator [Hamadaea sp.]
MEYADDVAPARFTSLPSWLLSRAAGVGHRLLTERLAEAGARGYHYRLLATLEEFGPASQATLGRRSGIHLSDLVAVLNDLEGRGFVERTPDPADKRRNVITITAAGRREGKRLGERLDQVQEELLAPLTAKEREQLTELLGRIVAHHQAA